jgi:hypothetical protein
MLKSYIKSRHDEFVDQWQNHYQQVVDALNGLITTRNIIQHEKEVNYNKLVVKVSFNCFHLHVFIFIFFDQIR